MLAAPQDAVAETLCSASLYHRRRRRLFGLPLQHLHIGLWFYEQLWMAYRPKWMVEIGTGMGATAIYLATYCRLAGIPFLSIDIARPHKKVPGLIKELGGVLICGDVFDEANADAVVALTGNGQGFLLCDGGDKAEELRTFGPQCSVGSIVVGHDYGFEWRLRNIKDISSLQVCSPWHQKAVELQIRAGVLKVV